MWSRVTYICYTSPPILCGPNVTYTCYIWLIKFSRSPAGVTINDDRSPTIFVYSMWPIPVVCWLTKFSWQIPWLSLAAQNVCEFHVWPIQLIGDLQFLPLPSGSNNHHQNSISVISDLPIPHLRGQITNWTYKVYKWPVKRTPISQLDIWLL
jgi:hypothetical protein